MFRSEDAMTRLPLCVCLFAASFALSTAGPVGPLPNVTSTELGLKEGSCALGDVVYLAGDEFPGANTCERCTCAAGQVSCTRQECQPRPGCKALHRPDHCCPTYQCDCEQEGRVYGNGEKLVDPQDPCRVCYCQGGEVVCRRIACFVRDDCQPRAVPGRCCPEYDNCPLRGVTSVHGTASASSLSAVNASAAAVPPSPPAPVKPGFTIKEITPVSEIPVTDVKVKEVPPPPRMDVAEYSSSKSPLIPREVSPESASSNAGGNAEVSALLDKDVTKMSTADHEVTSGSSTPSKISLSTQDSINSDIYSSEVPKETKVKSPAESVSMSPLPTKAPMLEEEDPTLFDHNPAFPPLPDDLSVLSNHDDEILAEQHFENENMPGINELIVTNDSPRTDAPAVQESPTTVLFATNGVTVMSDGFTDVDVPSEKIETGSGTTQQTSMISLRSVLPTRILDIPSFISDETDGFDTTTDGADLSSSENDSLERHKKVNISDSVLSPTTEHKYMEVSSTELLSVNPSSLLIETSDQNPHDASDKEGGITPASSTASPIDMEPGKDTSLEIAQTTEFYPTSFGSQETATDMVELIKETRDTDSSSALVEPPRGSQNTILTDLINLVGDVAAISDHNDSAAPAGPGSTLVSDSEELIPVNTGFKSKNNNWSLNSITEVPSKSRSPSPAKQKQVEIEDEDEAESLTDAPPPHDTAEPTTRRPLIDHVPDAGRPQSNGTMAKKDIEIITKSYVPAINRRPTKVVMSGSTEVVPPSTPPVQFPTTQAPAFSEP